MAESREWLVQWLRDAHAMEEQAETMLSGQLSRIESYPQLSERIRTHLEETKEQARRLKRCLDGLDEGSSMLKDAGGKLTATAQSISGVFAGDEVMKGSLASYTFEHMEIASYTILIAAANAAGEAEISRVCEQNLHEEEAMAEWLKSNLPQVTEQFLARADTDSDSAKR
ncbi:ferritin-like domain-containing protein [bacterium M00.F.Ca.ET.159.01.1.1]|nr:ferritin-like domain-containing protein [bacterium M00.F.Ca.ET.159.01.1.1]TGT87775.1 ferritin-like domain-containing protein [bacterium M00.F.Ca.ET.157.01.1.1]